MNTATPLIREGLMPFRRKPSFYFKILVVLTVQAVVIVGLLLQGCKSADTRDAISITPIPEPAPPTITANPDAARPPETKTSFPSVVANQPHARPTTQPLQRATAAPIGPPAATHAKEYMIAPGDTLKVIAHQKGVALKALIDANPGINPKKLQVGQKLKVPTAKAA